MSKMNKIVEEGCAGVMRGNSGHCRVVSFFCVRTINVNTRSLWKSRPIGIDSTIFVTMMYDIRFAVVWSR